MQKDITGKLYSSFMYNGWRPTLYWVIVVSVAYSFVINPILMVILDIIGVETRNGGNIDSSIIFSLVTLVLGTTTIRGIEKYKNSNIEKHGEKDVDC